MSATFSCDRNVLNRCLMRSVDTCAKGAMAKRKPVLATVRVSVNGSVTLDSNDLEQQCRQYVKTGGVHAGDDSVLVDAKALKRIVTACKAKSLDVDIDSDGLTIGGTTLPSVADPSEYPFDIQSHKDAGVTLSGEQLARLIDRTAFACDTESSRYALGALLVELDPVGGYCRLVGTDGRRLATDYCGQHTEDLQTALWPVAFARKALKAIRKASAVSISADEQYIYLICVNPEGEAHYRFRQIEGRFPKWREVIPEHTLVCDLDADELASACETIIAATAHLDDEKICPASVNVSIADNLAVISADHADCSVHLDCCTFEDSSAYTTALTVKLNATYLRDFAKACKGCILTIEAKDRAFDKPNDKQEDHAVRIECRFADYVVMPLAK